MVSLLLTRKANVNEMDAVCYHHVFIKTRVIAYDFIFVLSLPAQHQRSPLHYAAFRGHVDIMSLLLTHNASVNANDQVLLMRQNRIVRICL